MCGIVACRRSEGSLEFLLSALGRMEYRGYDSAGVALLSPTGQLDVVRSSGRVGALAHACQHFPWSDGDGSSARLGLGHTRWATHGPPTEQNAHPHRDCTRQVAVVHNGIIENAAELADALRAAGHVLLTGVDTEVVAHLVEDELHSGATLTRALLSLHGRLEGSWALAVADARSACLAVTTRRSPLLVGVGAGGAHAASDMAAFVDGVSHVAPLEDGDVVDLDDAPVWWSAAGQRPAPVLIPVQVRRDDGALNGHADHMSKEIAEQPSLAAAIVQRLGPGLDGGLWADLRLPTPRRIRFLGCGTSLNAACAAARVFSRRAGIATDLLTASEVSDVLPVPGGLTIAMSQSGETADVLTALDCLDGPVLAITNNEHSTLARRADAVLGCGAGLEIGVAATKTFTAQVLVTSALGLSLAAHQAGTDRQHWALVRSYCEVPGRLEQAHFLSAPVAAALAEELADQSGLLFLSRAEGMPYAAEGALKLKELTYRWAQAYPAGELKHGPIALVTSGTPVIVVDGGDLRKLAGNIAEVEARGARVVRIGGSAATLPVLASDRPVPAWGPLESVLPLQHLARCLARHLGRDPDKPRNLAKSVTVE